MRSAHPILVFLAISLPVAAQEPAEKVSVLIVSGANNHDWEWTTPSLETILDESGLFDVAITYEPAKTLADENELAKYAAVVLDYNGQRWGADAEANFLEAVTGGTGVVVVHAANNAFPGWVEYETLVGHLWRQGTGHGRFHAFDVEIADRSHPVTATLPDLRAHPDELYHQLQHMHGSEKAVLGSALSSEESGGTGQLEPMILVGMFGAGRVFHTPLGHVWKDNEPSRASHTDPQFRNLIVRGTDWAATGQVRDGLARPNTISAAEARDGWRLLFDGETTRGWHGWKKDGFPEKGWEVVNGCLRRTSGGGDIVSDQTFEDFELAFEWKTASGVNSGVKYRLPEPGSGSPIGPEYQILDDPGTKEDDNPLSASAALYAVVEPGAKTLAHAGAFNHSRIVCRGNTIEHWLNGSLVVEAEVGSDDWQARKAKSKFRGVADFAAPKEGHILLQDHGGEVWFRSIRVRELETSEGVEVPLLAGAGLEGWTPVGAATWRRDGDTIVGSVGDGLGRNAFLRTDETFEDFIFEVDVLPEVVGNSGIQFRSHQKDNGVVFGYQAEIDCSKRAWSGGIYDESRRGWLADLKENPAGRQAFRVDDWNHYRIEARGSHLRVWVNGVLTAELVDDADAEGFLALQVHGGKTGTFRWRQPRLWRL